MTALATVHATAYGYQQDCGGRKAFLERYPIIKDQNRLPKFSQMKVIKYLFPLKATKNGIIYPFLQQVFGFTRMLNIFRMS